jgi:hypothetical protein
MAEAIASRVPPLTIRGVETAEEPWRRLERRGRGAGFVAECVGRMRVHDGVPRRMAALPREDYSS